MIIPITFFSSAAPTPDVPPITPEDVSGLAAWFDAADITTITLAGNQVAGWQDKSVNSNNAAQADESLRPTYSADIGDGMPGISHTGEPDACRLNLNNPIVLQDYTVFAVIKDQPYIFHPVAGLGYACLLHTYAYGGDNMCVDMFDDTEMFYNDGNSDFSTHVTHVVSVALNSDAMAYSPIYIDGVAISDYGDCRYNGTKHTFTVESVFTTSNADNPATVRELILYNRKLSNTERQQIEAYLKKKWRTPIPTLKTMGGLIGWWDAADASTTTLGANNQITQWADKSGAGHHATQEDGTYRPTLTLNAQNGLSRVDFSQNSNLLFPPAKPKSFTAIVVLGVSPTLSNAGFYPFIGDNMIGMYDFNGTKYFVAQNTAFSSEALLDVNGDGVPTGIMSVSLSETTASYTDGRIYWNGASLPDSGNSSAMERWASINGMGVPGCDAGYICESILFDRVLSVAERQQVEAYLRAKWGL